MGQRNIKYLKKEKWLLLGIIWIFFSILIVGIQRDLPYIPDIDEPNYVTRAIKMASSGDLNPHRFAHPASTTYYPLVIIYHTWNAVTHHGMFFHPDPNLQNMFNAKPWEFYILGRFLSIIYAVLSIPVIFLLGRDVFNAEIGVIGVLFFSFYSLIAFYSRMVRTDSAALFFGVFSLWLLVRVYKKPSPWTQLFVGLVIGLSIASRYFMAVLIIPLLVIDVTLLLQVVNRKKAMRLILTQIIIGLTAIGAGFVLSTPYLFVSFDTFLHDIAFERRDTNPGFDGLSPLGNFFWYITHAIPTIMSLPQAIMMVVGIYYSLWKRHFLGLMLIAFSLMFVAFISQFSLHWYRWIIQIMPILALFAAYGVYESIVLMSISHSGFGRKKQIILTSVMITLLMVIPVKKVISLDLKASHYSTRIVALEWIQENLPPKSKIAFGEYSAPLENIDFETFKAWSLAQSGYTMDDFRAKYDYMVVSSSIYDRFFAEPKRYIREINFYRDLFEHEKLLYETTPNWRLGGGTIRVFQLH